MSRLARKVTPLAFWYDTAVTPLYASIGAGCVMCAYVCGRNLTSHPDITWYKTKDADGKIFNNHNTASSYHSQRLFLATGSKERSTRMLGMGRMYGNNNCIMANKLPNGANPNGVQL